jgi:DNA-binding response OmpR family regulator
MRARILLLEDDPRIRAAMQMALEHEGQKVHEAESGEQALRDFAGEPFDIALIDLMLPGIDGFEVCRTLRRVSDIPIIMVTARTDSHDVVAGLEAGADDYVSKPFMAKELSARIRALLRRARGQGTTRPRSTFGEIEVLPDEGVVRRSGQDLHLTRPSSGCCASWPPIPAGCCRGRSCWRASGTTTISATAAWSTCRSGGCGPRSSPTRRTPATS